MTEQRHRAKPRLACEVTAERVIAARRSDDGHTVASVNQRTLPAGAVTPGMGLANLVMPETVEEAIADTLAAVGGRGKDVIAILPDASVRLVLLEFDLLPGNTQEATALVRFRLKKSVPFDVERAAVSFDARRGPAGVRVVAAAAPAHIVQEYEAAFRAAGYHAGVVLPSIAATLGAVQTDEPTMVLKVDVTTTTMAIVDGNELRLLRTVENPSGEAARLAQDVYPSLVFFEDTYHTPVRQMLAAGRVTAEWLAQNLESEGEMRIGDVDARRHLTSAADHVPPVLLAGVVGALVG